MIKHLAILLYVISLTASAATPFLAAVLPLPDAPLAGRASADGKRLVLQLKGNGARPGDLQILDIADPQQPRLQGFLALPKIAGMALSADGQSVLVRIDSEPRKFDQESAREVVAVSLADPANPRELWRESLKARDLILSANANAYAFSQLAADKSGQWETSVVRIDDRQSPLTVREDPVMHKMYLSPNADFLANTSCYNLRLWDLRQKTPVLYEQSDSFFTRYDCEAKPMVLNDGHIVVQDTRLYRIGVYAPEPGMSRISAAMHEPGRTDFIPSSAGNLFWTTNGYGQFRQLDLHELNKPAWGRIWSLPFDSIPLTSVNNLFFAGKPNAPVIKVYQLDRDGPPALDWPVLARAHKAGLDRYRANLQAGKGLPEISAVREMEQAEVIQAIEAPLNGLPPPTAAEILNDYAFLAAKNSLGAPANLIENALRRAIELDPRRKTAHLNLADFLRDKFALSVANGGDAEVRRREIIDHYRQYLSLGGKRTPGIAAFLQEDPADICDLIAAYANARRLGELVAQAGANIPYNNKNIDLNFTLEGTAHVPDMHVTESVNDYPLKETEQPGSPPNAEEPWGGDNLGLLTYRNRRHILFYKDLQHPVSSRSLNDGQACLFTTATQEEIGPKASQPRLCELIKSKRTPSRIEFAAAAGMPEDRLNQRWSTSMVGARLLDFANDGQPVNVAELEYSGGGGAGCNEIYYDVISRDGKQFAAGPKHDLLLKLQNADPQDRYPIRPCENSPGFFSYEHRIYFETKPRKWPPEDEWNKYHRVIALRNGKAADVCDFQLSSSVTGRHY